jgi:hypothetical protein
LYDSLIAFSPAGMWAAGLSLDAIKFTEKLPHKLAAAYIMGTNEKGTPDNYRYYGGHGIQFLITEDSLIEFDFTTKYSMGEYLTFAIEFAYFLTDFSKDGRGEADDAFVGQFGIRCAF